MNEPSLTVESQKIAPYPLPSHQDPVQTNVSSERKTTARVYSPFWALEIFFIVISFWLAFQLYDIWNKKVLADKFIVQLIPKIKEADAAKQRLIALAQDLNKVGANDPQALQLLKDSQIQIDNSATGASSSSGK